MKRFSFSVCFLMLVLQAGCYESRFEISTPSVTNIATQQITPTPVIDMATQQLEPTPFPLPTESPALTYPPETRLTSQCLKVESIPIKDIGSSGVLILEDRAVLDDGNYKFGTFHLNMKSGQMTEITIAGEGQVEPIVSPNGEWVAYEHVTYNTAGKVIKTELVVADAKGQPISVMPWDGAWIEMPTWLDNERLVINASGLNPEESAGDKPATLLILNPFSRKLQILKPDFPKVLDIHATLSAILPFWEGWSGAIYDPTLTRAIYPMYLDDNEDWFTYAIWDPSQRRLIATLEDIYAVASSNTAYPMPKWSPDGSQFVFQGVVPARDPMNYELYAVSRDGETKQLTNLSSVAYVWESTYSWSPDGRYIAMFLSPPIGGVRSDNAHVAVLDTTTLAVTDYCVNNTLSGEGYGSGSLLWSPIWSPDGHQFVITDWYKKDHRHVVLVDIEKKIAVKVAEDVQPVGWMISP